MFKKNAKHRANDASDDVHRPPLPYGEDKNFIMNLKPRCFLEYDQRCFEKLKRILLTGLLQYLCLVFQKKKQPAF